jgi:protein-tyrosine-phosphatase
MADLLTRIRHAPDRWWHPVRRSAVRAAVAQRRPGTVLVVCHGNICRSPFAAAVLRRALTGTGIAVASAGFVGPGRRPPADAVSVAARRGVDLSAHRSQLLDAATVRGAGLVVVMEADQRRAICDRFGLRPRDVVVLGDFDPAPIETRTVRDPLNAPPAVFEAVYARIDACTGGLADALRRR